MYAVYKNAATERLVTGFAVLDGDNLWGAVAWNRFGSHLLILQTPRMGWAVVFLSIFATVPEWTTKAVPSNGAPKALPI